MNFCDNGYDTFYWEFPSISEEKLFYLKLKIPEKIFNAFFERSQL